MASVRNLLILCCLGGGLLLSSNVLQKALTTVQMPFAGILPFHNLFIGAFTQPEWKGGALALTYHDRVLSVDGGPLSSADDWQRLLREKGAPLGAVQTQISHGKSPLEVSLPISPLPARDVFRIFTPLFATGLAFWLIGMIAALVYPAPAGLVAFLAYCFSTAIYFLTAYDFHTTYELRYLLLAAFSVLPASVLHLCLAFPRPWSSPGRRFVPSIFYGISALLALPYLYYFDRDPVRWKIFEYILFLYLSLAYVVWLGATAWRAFYDRMEEVRRQCRLMLIPLLPGFGAIFAGVWLVFMFDVPIPLHWMAPLSALFPVAVAFAMFRANLFLVDRLEAQVQERTAELRKAQAELTEATKLAAVGQLAAGTAHEIGNAMNVVLSNLPVLKKYGDSLVSLVESQGDSSKLDELKRKADYEFLRQDLPELLSNLTKGAEHTVNIVSDLKAFAKPPASEKTLLNVGQVLASVLRLLRAQTGEGIKIKTDFQPVPDLVGAPGPIHQLFLNLLLNAIQAIEGEGTIDMTVTTNGREVVTTIADSGKGISKEQLSRVIEPFYTTKPGGTGLGLSVCHGIVTAHGGKLTIASEPNRGTMVTVTLPISPPDAS
ncbi:MAG TPA: HAMP domain-containing sensor histidine kinase [Bdellovibrionota bacterium]|nr:HAMP domain-containing sensor histidine kinase [Bdellovibrionota bacterium]